VAAYACVNGLLSFWVFAVEKGTVYVGTNKAGDRIAIQSSTKKHVPIYNLTITVTEGSKGGASREIKLARPFREWFDKNGAFVPVPFQEMFASNVDVIGKADPKRVATEKKKGGAAKADTSKTMDEKWASLLAESYVDVAAEDEGKSSATPAKASKRRGKKA
jgi:signal peptidase complex subunit 2